MIILKKLAIVTGAANGMGKAIALKLNQEGYDIVAIDIDEEKLNLLEQEISQNRVIKYGADIGDPNFARQLKKDLQNENIELLVNNAGIRFAKSILDETDTEIEQTLKVNLMGPFYLMREIGSLMAEKQHGFIINIASVAGQRGFRERASYCASKGGLIALTKAAAMDLARKGVRVFAVCPGFTKTTMTLEGAEDLARQYVPIGKSGTAEDIAQVVYDLTKWEVATGTTITVDGGLIEGFMM